MLALATALVVAVVAVAAVAAVHAAEGRPPAWTWAVSGLLIASVGAIGVTVTALGRALR